MFFPHTATATTNTAAATIRHSYFHQLWSQKAQGTSQVPKYDQACKNLFHFLLI